MLSTFVNNLHLLSKFSSGSVCVLTTSCRTSYLSALRVCLQIEDECLLSYYRISVLFVKESENLIRFDTNDDFIRLVYKDSRIYEKILFDIIGVLSSPLNPLNSIIYHRIF